jgi:type IX secretion system PorP/SprF family membrane protein
MKKTLLTSIAVIAIGILSAQDIHFSQFTQSPLVINPSSAGFFDGYYRATANYKNQWASMGKAFNTMAAAFDMPLGIKRRKSAYFGVGALIFNDKAGDAGMKKFSASLNASGIVPISPYLKMAAGLSAAFNQQSINLSNLNFGNQYNGNGFDPNIQSNELIDQSYSFFDVGAGISFGYNNARGGFARDDIFKINFGIAGYHLNRPQQSYFSGGTDRLYMRLVAHGDARIDFPKTKFSIVPKALFMMQGPNMEILAGALCRYRLQNGTKVTGVTSESGISLGCSYRYGDAIIPEAYFEFANFAAGLSYDLNISSYKQVSNLGGGFEISLKYINLIDALFDKRIK